jgi:hypothetical protein
MISDIFQKTGLSLESGFATAEKANIGREAPEIGMPLLRQGVLETPNVIHV